MFGFSKQPQSTAGGGWRRPLKLGSIGLTLLAAGTLAGTASAELGDAPQYRDNGSTELTFKHGSRAGHIIKHAAPRDWRHSRGSSFTFKNGHHPGRIIKHAAPRDWRHSRGSSFTFKNGHHAGRIIKHSAQYDRRHRNSGSSFIKRIKLEKLGRGYGYGRGRGHGWGRGRGHH